MGSKVDVPATTDPTATDWQNFIAWVEKAQTGKINITFSNMDNTSEPKIQAGSIVEIAGSLYSFSAEEEATGWGDIDDSTQAYMALTASGDTVSAEWTDTAPVYRDDLQGWYESGTNKRYVLRCYKESSTEYTEKFKYQQEYGNKYFSGNTFFSKGITTNGKCYDDTSPTKGEVFDFLSPYISNIGDTVMVNGVFSIEPASGTIYSYITSYAERITSDRIDIYTGSISEDNTHLPIIIEVYRDSTDDWRYVNIVV